ncbi:hypothetical protein SAMN05444162_0456 [Paenibacillaceae bacterium GAS479]|nr:hypothetical protein SAMN05444162_0456 [Paenibacillaceae bacterium GAS479]
MRMASKPKTVEKIAIALRLGSSFLVCLRVGGLRLAELIVLSPFRSVSIAFLL